MQICGIDEAGRGPLAGPLVMAGVVFTQRVYKLDDSKKLSPQAREKLYEKIINATQYTIVIIDNDTIDQIGISACISQGLKEIISALHAKRYIFDGNSKFGVENIEPVIKADQTIKEVMAASILAKVTRDRIMCEMDKEYPEYGFCKHKGYGTKEHIEAIQRYGFSPIHRKSFRPKALQPTLF
ncbi:ribonuclease HII [Nitratiruptor sp. SB155-2]|uniref:ribonuclease HII n=1 Tax=Nitratiruptor sp. (strain SB155-2) TaxID=387092 RepID=UPI0001586D37|nr:ribonuclease HII [Nitratiruptor sp. SB155-2]BAF69332.1 ribonuclease HII [Nitratiruptor sp. SB155-2]